MRFGVINEQFEGNYKDNGDDYGGCDEYPCEEFVLCLLGLLPPIPLDLSCLFWTSLVNKLSEIAFALSFEFLHRLNIYQKISNICDNAIIFTHLRQFLW